MWPTVHDFRLAIRRWTTRPALGVTAVMILGLGVGATTSIYSIVDAVLLRPLAWTEPDRLVNVYVARPELRLSEISKSPRAIFRRRLHREIRGCGEAPGGNRGPSGGRSLTSCRPTPRQRIAAGDLDTALRGFVRYAV